MDTYRSPRSLRTVGALVAVLLWLGAVPPARGEPAIDPGQFLGFVHLAFEPTDPGLAALALVLRQQAQGQGDGQGALAAGGIALLPNLLEATLLPESFAEGGQKFAYVLVARYSAGPANIQVPLEGTNLTVKVDDGLALKKVAAQLLLKDWMTSAGGRLVEDAWHDIPLQVLDGARDPFTPVGYAFQDDALVAGQTRAALEGGLATLAAWGPEWQDQLPGPLKELVAQLPTEHDAYLALSGAGWRALLSAWTRAQDFLSASQEDQVAGVGISLDLVDDATAAGRILLRFSDGQDAPDPQVREQTRLSLQAATTLLSAWALTRGARVTTELSDDGPLLRADLHITDYLKLFPH